MILYSKTDLHRTLEFYDVNRVVSMPAAVFLSKLSEVSPSSLWAIRTIDRRGGGGLFLNCLSVPDVVDALKVHEEDIPKLIVCESMFVADREDLLCNGEVELFKDEFGTWAYKGFVNTTPGVNVREAASLVGDVCGPGITLIRTRHQVPDVVIDKLWSKSIINSAVEFSLYRKPVGIHHRHLLIWEIRRY